MNSYYSYFLIFCSLFNLLNFVILFFLSAFLVRFRRELSSILSNAQSKESKENVYIKRDDSKTWDQKYEEELTQLQKAIRQNTISGEP